MELCSLFVGEECRDGDRELEDCLCDFCFCFVWELNAPRFVEDVSVFGKLLCEFRADDVDFGSIVEKEFERFVFNEYCGVFELRAFTQEVWGFVVGGRLCGAEVRWRPMEGWRVVTSTG